MRVGLIDKRQVELEERQDITWGWTTSRWTHLPSLGELLTYKKKIYICMGPTNNVLV